MSVWYVFLFKQCLFHCDEVPGPVQTPLNMTGAISAWHLITSGVFFCQNKSHLDFCLAIPNPKRTWTFQVSEWNVIITFRNGSSLNSAGYCLSCSAEVHCFYVYVDAMLRVSAVIQKTKDKTAPASVWEWHFNERTVKELLSNCNNGVYWQVKHLCLSIFRLTILLSDQRTANIDVFLVMISSFW